MEIVIDGLVLPIKSGSNKKQQKQHVVHEKGDKGKKGSASASASPSPSPSFRRNKKKDKALKNRARARASLHNPDTILLCHDDTPNKDKIKHASLLSALERVVEADEDEEVLLDYIRHMDVSDPEKENEILDSMKFGEDIDYIYSSIKSRKGRKKHKVQQPQQSPPQQQFISIYTTGNITSDTDDEFDDDDEIDLDLEAMSYKKNCRLKRRNQSSNKLKHKKQTQQPQSSTSSTPPSKLLSFTKAGYLNNDADDHSSTDNNNSEVDLASASNSVPNTAAVSADPSTPKTATAVPTTPNNSVKARPYPLEKKVSFQLINDVIVLSSSSEEQEEEEEEDEQEKQVVPNIDMSSSNGSQDEVMGYDNQEEYADESDCIIGGESDCYDTDLEKSNDTITNINNNNNNNNNLYSLHNLHGFNNNQNNSLHNSLQSLQSIHSLHGIHGINNNQNNNSLHNSLHSLHNIHSIHGIHGINNNQYNNNNNSSLHNINNIHGIPSYYQSPPPMQPLTKLHSLAVDESSSESEDDDRIVSCYLNGSEPSGDESCFFTNPFKSPAKKSPNNSHNNVSTFTYNSSNCYMKPDEHVIELSDDDDDNVVDISSESEEDPEEERKGSFADWIRKVHGTSIKLPAKPVNKAPELIDVDNFEPFIRKPDSRMIPPKPTLNPIIVECLKDCCTTQLRQEIELLYDRGMTFSSYTSKQLASIATLFDNLILNNYSHQLPLWPMSKVSMNQVEYLTRQYDIFDCVKKIKERKILFIVIHTVTKKPSIRKKERYIESALTSYMNAHLVNSYDNIMSSPSTSPSSSGVFQTSPPSAKKSGKHEKTVLYNRKGKISPSQSKKHQKAPGKVKLSPRQSKDNMKSVKPQHGDIVDQHRSPIPETNVGNLLLKKMGWSGGGLGASGQGLDTPLQAVIRKDRLGLGL